MNNHFGESGKVFVINPPRPQEIYQAFNFRTEAQVKFWERLRAIYKEWMKGSRSIEITLNQESAREKLTNPDTFFVSLKETDT